MKIKIVLATLAIISLGALVAWRFDRDFLLDAPAALHLPIHQGQGGNIEVLNSDSSSKDSIHLPDRKVSYIKEMHITDNPISARNVAKTSVDTDGGITLVINADNETPQKADIYIQRTDQSTPLIRDTVEIPENGGTMDIENDLPTGRYRIILISNNQGMEIDFQTKEIL